MYVDKHGHPGGPKGKACQKPLVTLCQPDQKQSELRFLEVIRSSAFAGGLTSKRSNDKGKQIRLMAAKSKPDARLTVAAKLRKVRQERQNFRFPMWKSARKCVPFGRKAATRIRNCPPFPVFLLYIVIHNKTYGICRYLGGDNDFLYGGGLHHEWNSQHEGLSN
jgi:hypothetical protein